MEDKMVRLTVEAEGIAKKYGSTVSKGIVEMNNRLCKQPVNNTIAYSSGPATLASTSCNLTVPMTTDSTYWNTFDEHIRSNTNYSLEHVTKLESFKQASDPSFRKIGKLDKEEELQEPVGRQGRNV